MTAKELVDLIFRHKYSDYRQWLFASEVNVSTGWSSDRRFDAVAMNCYPGKSFERHVIEVKVDRNDWLNEIRHPEKRMKAMLLSHRFYFVLDEGVYDRKDFSELKTGKDQVEFFNCGIYEVKSGELFLVQKAKLNKTPWPMPDGFMLSFARKCRNDFLRFSHSE